MEREDALKLLDENPPAGKVEESTIDQPDPSVDVVSQGNDLSVPAPTNSAAPETNSDGSLGEALKKLQQLVEGTQVGEITPFLQAEQKRKESYLAANQAQDIPLDVDTGVPSWEKFVRSFQRQKETQIKYLQNKYGEGNVREDEQGGMIVRVLDEETQKPKDIKVDPWNMSASDLLSLAGSVPEIAGGVIATLAGRRIPGIGSKKGVLGLQRDVGAMAIGGEAAGAVKDVGAALGAGTVPELDKIAKERAAMTGLDIAMGEATLGAGRFLKFMKSPFSGSRGEVQFAAHEAQKYFKDKHGVFVPLSIGESTGSPVVGRTEIFYEKLPGGATPFEQLKAKQEDALRELQTIMMGGVPESDEVIGKEMLDTLSTKIAPLQESVQSAKSGLQKVATRDIESVFAGAVGPQRAASISETGKEVRDAVIAKRDSVKAEANRLYGIAEAAPGGQGKVFDGANLQAKLRAYEKTELPSAQTTTTAPSSVLGPTGQPIMVTSTGEEVLNNWVSPNVLTKIRQVTSLENPKFSLSDLQQMRREIYDDMAASEAITGLPNRRLNELGKILTSSIDDGIKALPSGDLRTALDAANKHYKEKVLPLNRRGLTELFRNQGEAGRIADNEVVSRLFSGGKAIERYNLMKETLGDTSPAFSNLKRQIADQILEPSRMPGGNVIDADSLRTLLERFRTDPNTKEIAEDVFGSKINTLFRRAKILGYAKEGNKVNADELASLLKEKSPTASQFMALVEAEAKRDSVYQNEILKSVADGTFGDKPLNPIDFVNRFMDKAKPSDLKQIMYMIKDKPEVVDDLRSKMVEKLFRDASRKAVPQDIIRLMKAGKEVDPTRIVSGTSMYDLMEAPATKDKYRTILGPNIYQDLAQYIRFESALEYHAKQFSAAGGLAAGMQISSMTRNGPLKYLYGATKDFVVARLLTSAPMRGWMTSMPAMEPQALSLILTSPQFLQAIAKEFPGVPGSNMVKMIKQSIDRYVIEQKADAERSQNTMGAGQRVDAKRQKAFQLLSSQPPPPSKGIGAASIAPTNNLLTNAPLTAAAIAKQAEKSNAVPVSKYPNGIPQTNNPIGVESLIEQ